MLGNCKTHEPHKIALLTPFLAAPPRLPIWAWSRLRGPDQLAGPENWRQNHRFFWAQQFRNCLCPSGNCKLDTYESLFWELRSGLQNVLTAHLARWEVEMQISQLSWIRLQEASWERRSVVEARVDIYSSTIKYRICGWISSWKLSLFWQKMEKMD